MVQTALKALLTQKKKSDFLRSLTVQTALKLLLPQKKSESLTSLIVKTALKLLLTHTHKRKKSDSLTSRIMRQFVIFLNEFLKC